MTCNNESNNLCTNNVHNIISAMIGDKVMPNYIGGLFNREDYPIFEGQECVQYIQEYVPFHLPQIQFILGKILDEYFINYENVRILDLGAGPGTVPMAFCRIFEQKKYTQNIHITTIEASTDFNNHIKIFKELNKNKKINIENILKLDLTQDTLVNLINDFDYDWINLANAFSIISQQNDFDDLNNYFYTLFQKILSRKKMAVLSIIEGKYKLIVDYLAQIGNIAKDGMKLKGYRYNTQLNAPYITNCNFFRTRWAVNQPYLNAITIKLYYEENNIGVKKD